jgi:hypothetical protein
VIRILIALCFLHAAIARAEDEPAETSSGNVPLRAGATTLLDARAPWRWELVVAPRLAPQIGAVAISGLDAVAKRGPVVDVLGDAVPAPRAWPYDVTGSAPTIPAPAEGQRIAAAFGIATFSLTPAQQGFEVLELALKYEDGVAVWLNGIEIVRQGLPRGPTTTLAPRPHGPEWETFFVPVAPGLLRAENVLAIEVHPSGRSDGAKVQAQLVGRKDRGIVRGPIISALDATTATIAVETDAGVEAMIEWGFSRDTKAEHTKSSPAGKRHRFDLEGLPANGDVFYRISAGVTRTQVYSFHTLPPPGAVIRIGVYGDVRGGHAVHRKIVEQMLREGLDLVAVTGDMVLRGPDEADWQRFFAVTRELLASIPYYPAVGNHDLGWGGAHHDAQGVFGLPPGPPGRPAGAFYYSRDVADIHLVFLDSNAYDRPEQETWLASDLAAARARKVRAILVITHDGPYARGYHGGSAIARDRYVPILLAHRVDLVFSGHDHIYQRGDAKGLRYVVSGGGGASLYGIRCGVTGRPKCKIDDGMQMVAKEHHYVVLTIGREVELCARKPDGTLLERCTKLRLQR